jgi:hypothetical protein
MPRKIITIAVIAMLSIGAQAGIASADLVQNGGFESSPNFVDWTATGAVTIDTASPCQGNNDALYTAAGATLYQTLSTTKGQVYTVSFYLKEPVSAGASNFEALWGTSLASMTVLDTPKVTVGTGYEEFQFNVTAPNVTSTSEIIEFKATGPAASQFQLDNVSVTPTPIPAAAWLLGSGLMGLLGLRNEKRSKVE